MLTKIETEVPLLDEPAGSVLATVPAGQTESIFSFSTVTSKPSPLSELWVAPTGLQVASGMDTFLP